MNLYSPETGFDYDAARSALEATRGLTNDKTRQAELTLILGAVCIDIASSLSILALRAATDMPDLVGFEPAQEADEAPRDFLVAGDLVRLREPDGKTPEVGEVIGLGFDQGDTFAVVRYAMGSEYHDEKFYTRNLERLIGDEVPAEVVERTVEYVDSIMPDEGDLQREPGTLDEDDIEEDFAEDVINAADALAERAKPKKKGKK